VLTGFQYRCHDRALTVWSASTYGYVTKNGAIILRREGAREMELVGFSERALDKRKKSEDFVLHYFA
jgi:hypothetical protein